MAPYIYKVIKTPKIITIITHNRKPNDKHNKKIHNKRKSVFVQVNYHNVYRAINRVKQLIECNDGQYTDNTTGIPKPTLFITYTYRENLTDITTANKDFNAFNKRLQKYLKNKLKYKQKVYYIAVPEFQLRGAVHYHVLYFNLPYIPQIYDLFNSLWDHGWVIFRKVHEFSPTQYLIKDMTKHFSLGTGTKRYFCSKGLLKPNIEVYDKPPNLPNKKILYYKEKQHLDYEVFTEIYAVDN